MVSDDRHEAAALWAAAGLPGRHVPLPNGAHQDWGHTPRNRALPLVRADFVLHVDDALLPGAPRPGSAPPSERTRGTSTCSRSCGPATATWSDLNGFSPTGTSELRTSSTGRTSRSPAGEPRTAATGRSSPGPSSSTRTGRSTGTRNRTTPPTRRTTSPLADCSAGFRVARARLVPAKPAWVDLAGRGGGVVREDCQVGWHALAARLFAGRDVENVAAGLGFSRPRLAPAARRLRLQNPGPGLPVDLTCPVPEPPAGDVKAVTAFAVTRARRGRPRVRRVAPAGGDRRRVPDHPQLARLARRQPALLS